MTTRILRPGRNAWQVMQSERLAFLVDASNYFSCLEKVFALAQRSIWIVGWDFNPAIRLTPELEPPGPRLGDLLRQLADSRPELIIRILIWSEGPFYSSHSLDLYRSMGWEDHPRIHLHFDLAHPIRGSHHQKLVVVDEQFAFAGGIDLTVERWDDRDHRAFHPCRKTPSGTPYPPVHDVQAMVMGEAASAFADLCRGRWKAATGRTAPAHAAIAHDWPDAPCASEIRGCEVAIALTDPGSGGRPRRRDVFRLTFDAIASARESLYIEAQYLASSVIARQLARHLRNRQGPEVVIVATRNTRGRFENMTMGYGMQRFVQRLRKADRYGRLRLSHAVVPDGEGAETSVLIHSKLLIVDDRFVRVGSSNLNNRSMGFDTECDLAVEAGDDVSCRAAIAALRDDLLAEHLNTSSAAFAEERQRGGLLHALDSFNTDARGLRPLTVERDRPNLLFALIKAMLDPKRPYWPLPLLAIPLRRLCRSGLRLMRQNV